MQKMHQKINNDYFYYYGHINTPITYTSGSQPFLGGDTHFDNKELATHKEYVILL
jgi:hypothetical protein